MDVNLKTEIDDTEENELPILEMLENEYSMKNGIYAMPETILFYFYVFVFCFYRNLYGQYGNS